MHAEGDRSSLVISAQAGDTKAVEQLIRLCQADARRYAQKHCQVSDIDDAVQESLLAISYKIKGLKAAAAFSAWLFTVIKRECQKLRRLMFRFEALDEQQVEAILSNRTDDALRLI
ncbi:MAG: sigma factor [Pseudomonas sp.]|uniref:RNA polymerase sigma factor n=1 Tax=Pseudomonas sp. TaxID=306 RepID=UPI003BB7F45A